MKYFCIGDQDAVTGFRLAGVEAREAKTPAEAKAAFKLATSMPEAGIVIITERIAEMIREDVDSFLYTASFPLVIEIPDRQGPGPYRSNIADIVKMAVGIKGYEK
jgi:V/A-type H+-transporting ATPase subunit F